MAEKEKLTSADRAGRIHVLVVELESDVKKIFFVNARSGCDIANPLLWHMLQVLWELERLADDLRFELLPKGKGIK